MRRGQGWIGIWLVVASTLAGPAAAQDPAPITQEEIQQLYQQIEAAENRRDVNTVLGYLAEECVVTIAHHGQMIRLTRSEYYEQIAKGLKSAKDYRYASKIRQVTINGPMAMVESVATESLTGADGYALESIMNQSTLVKRVDGRLKIFAVYATPSDAPAQPG